MSTIKAKAEALAEALDGPQPEPRYNDPYYVKRKGRFICKGVLNQHHDATSNGHYLMTVQAGSVGYRPIKPAYKEVEAALREVSEAMLDALHEANKSLPRSIPLTAREKRAWRAYRKVLGNDCTVLTYTGCSMQELIDAGVQVLRARLCVPK